jgi:thymidylate synthase
MKNSFNSASEAFDYLYDIINDQGQNVSNTRVVYNCGFYILNPLNNNIKSDFRKWNKNYADFEWQWYLSGNPDATEIAKRAPIWLNHIDENGNVMSNYGHQWKRNNQLDLIIDKLKNNPSTRQAVISIYDGKEINNYKFDTPCTLSIHFQIINEKLCMTVNMRSNDLWFGFCNDQYCFSKLQEMVSKELNLEIGWYYHFSSNIHLYNNYLNKNK